MTPHVMHRRFAELEKPFNIRKLQSRHGAARQGSRPESRFQICNARRTNRVTNARASEANARYASCTFQRQMTGVIRTRHLFTHCVTIIRGFGLKAYLSCVWRVVRHPIRKSTFLGTIY